jgi:hypothetical protein
VSSLREALRPLQETYILRRACWNKTPFSTRAEAIGHGIARDGWRLYPYRCQYGNGNHWHLSKQRRAKEGT